MEDLIAQKSAACLFRLGTKLSCLCIDAHLSGDASLCAPKKNLKIFPKFRITSTKNKVILKLEATDNFTVLSLAMVYKHTAAETLKLKIVVIK